MRLYGFIVPVIVGAIGLTGAAATFATIAITAAAGIGLAYAAKALMPKPQSGAGQSGLRVGLQVATDAPRDVILGEAATGGQLVYWHTYGPSNDWLQLAIALASHPIEGVTELWINGEKVTWNSSTGAVDGFPDLTVKVYDGTQTTADAGLVANSGGRWTSSEVGGGVAYAVVTAKYSQATYPRGIPQFIFRVRGAKLYDPRSATTVYTDNAAVIAYNLLRGISYNGIHLVGLRAPASAIRSDDAIAAMNACDETILSEKRYRCGFVADCGMSNRDVIAKALAAMGGKIVHSGGIYRIMAGVAQSSVATITDMDLIAAEPLTTSSRLPRSEMVNAVLGSFADPAIGHKLRPLPARTSAIDEAEDGGIRLPVTIDLVSVFSATQAQRLMELERRRGRRMGTVQMTVRPRWSVIESGDWITYTSDRRGYVSKTFEVVRTSRRRDQIIELTLRETDAAVDDFAAGDILTDATVTDLPPGAPPAASLALTSVAAVALDNGAGLQTPGVSVQWTAPNDATFQQLRIEYRRVGDTIALEHTVSDPNAGAATIVSGVQGGVTYEARVLPVTAPSRPSTWSSWVAASAATSNQVVAESLASDVVADGSVGVDQLDAQTAFELALNTALATVPGSVASYIADMEVRFERIASAIDINFEVATGADNRIVQTQRTLVTERNALVEQITTAVAALQIDIDTRATTSYVDSIELRVDATESGLTTQGTAITGLQSQIDDPTTGLAATATVATTTATAVNHATTGLATRAAASVVTGIQSQIDHPSTGLAATATVATTTQTAVNHPTTGLATRASASTLTTVSNTLDGVETSVSQMLSTVGGNLQYLMRFTSGGTYVGWISADGTASGTDFSIGATLFRIFDPSVGGGTPVQMVNVQTISGTPRLTVNGDILARSIEAGTISAVKGSIGVLTGLSGNYVLNSETGYWGTAVSGVADGVNYINMATGAFRLGG